MLGRVAQLQILTRTKRTAFVPSSCLRLSFSAPRAKAIAVRPFRGQHSAIGKPLLSAVVLNPDEEIGQQPGQELCSVNGLLPCPRPRPHLFLIAEPSKLPNLDTARMFFT